MKRFPVFALLIFLAGCSVHEYAMQENIRAALTANDPQKALKIAESDKFYTDEASTVLKRMELGRLHYLNGEDYQALRHFDAAQAKARELYTKSLLNAALSAVAGERKENYQGESYELSLLRFYQSLIHYRLYLKGEYEAFTDENGVQTPQKILTDKEKKEHLRAARAVLLDWDAQMQSYQNEKAGEAVFKRDMAAKLWGGFVHEQNKLSEDRQIARGLYKEVPLLLFRNYNLYPAYNEKAGDFAGNFETLPKLSEAETREKFVSPTKQAETLQTYAQTALSNLAARKPDNVFILLQTGLIARKKAKIVSYQIPWFLILGSYSDNSFRRFVSFVLPGQKIRFELPVIRAAANAPDFKIVLQDSKGKTAAEKAPALIDPASQIAERDLKSRESKMYAEKASRLAAKHIAALATAYQTYDKNNEATLWIARMAYSAAALLIEQSERADLRYWSTLPENIWMQSFRLPAGKYELNILKNGDSVRSETIEVPEKGVIFKDIVLN